MDICAVNLGRKQFTFHLFSPFFSGASRSPSDGSLLLCLSAASSVLSARKRGKPAAMGRVSPTQLWNSESASLMATGLRAKSSSRASPGVKVILCPPSSTALSPQPALDLFRTCQRPCRLFIQIAINQLRQLLGKEKWSDMAILN